MSVLKLAGRLLPAGSTNYSYTHDTGMRRPKRHGLVWLFFATVMICGGVGTYYRLKASQQPTNVASQAPSQPESAQLTPTNYETPSKVRSQAVLEAQIEAWGQSHSEQQWGAVVQQLTNGSLNVNYRAESPFHPASLETLLALQTLTSHYAYSTWNQPLAATGMSISDCVTKMIKDSDKNCTTAIGILIGWKGVNYELKKAGLTSTDLANYDVNKLHTSASDVETYLHKFYQSPDSPAKQFILKLLKQQTLRDGIPAGSPGCKVYDKAGEYGQYRNDAALVVCPKVTYNLVVLSKGGTYDQIADLSKLVNKFLTD